MSLAARLEVPLTQAQLAVLIGVVELTIGEVFKNASEWAFSWYRRWILGKKGRFRISERPFANSYHTVILSSILIIFVAVVITLELSIKDANVRTNISEPTRCFGPDRDNRYLTKGGPKPAELDDDRVGPYIVRARCKNRLFENTLQGPTAMDRGYPRCLPPFDEPENITLSASLKGCGIGVVAKSPDGDYHCDLLPDEVLNKTKSRLAGTDFLGIYSASYNSSGSYFVTENNRTSRYISNVEIPKDFVRRSLPAIPPVELRCERNSVECYNRVGQTALTLPKILQSYNLGKKIILIKALSGADSSSVCILSSGDITLYWSRLNHVIPEAERNGRSGPILTNLKLTGRGRCVKNLSPLSARLYYDSMENIDLRMQQKKKKGSVSAKSLDRSDPLVVLKEAAVVNGLKVTERESKLCEMWVAVNGSSMETGKFIAAVVFSIVLMVLTFVALFFIAFAKNTCLVRVDPLDPLWPVRHLLFSGSPTVASSGLKHFTGDGGEGGNSSVSVPTYSDPPSPLSLQSNIEDDIPPLASAQPAQRNTPPRQPRLGQRVGSGSTVQLRQDTSRGISWRSPISFPRISDADEGNSSTPGCISRGITIRSPIVRTSDGTDDNLWIGIQEDPEDGVARFTPHANEAFESLRRYPREIQ